MFLIFDTETTGLPFEEKEIKKLPRLVQLAWQLHDETGKLIEHGSYLIKPADFDIPFYAKKTHGISTELALQEGKDLSFVLEEFEKLTGKAQFFVGHNLIFDVDVLSAEMIRKGRSYEKIRHIPILDTMSPPVTDFCRLPGGKGGKFKPPKLTELYKILFNEELENAHNATADVEATARVFFELIRLRVLNESNTLLDSDVVEKIKQTYPGPVPSFGLTHVNFFKRSRELELAKAEKEIQSTGQRISIDRNTRFAHLHVYSQYSILESTVKHKDLIAKAAEYNLPAIAITDKSNMFGTFRFWLAVNEHNKKQTGESKKIKPVIGVELNVCRDHKDKTKQDNGHPVVLLAKNKKGYENLLKLVSIANLEGFYYVPRIDKDLLRQYREGIIALSGGVEGEVGHYVLKIGQAQAEQKLLEWKEIFGEDFYLEVMRHGLEPEEVVNKTFKIFSAKYGVKLIATNQVYYMQPEDFEAHEILLCVRDGKKLSDPVGPGRNQRKALPVNEYYFKSPSQMIELFEIDMPEAIVNIGEVLDKIEWVNLEREIIVPKFEVPDSFRLPGDTDGSKSQAAYLRHLVFEGAKKRWKNLTSDIRKRLEYELEVIVKEGFAGYFLIVWDVIKKAKEMGVRVGPGRGSAAGSAVAYVLEITDVDPIKYNLLFERFLNPNRVSMPDIDMDFDDMGRSKVIDYVVNKYGRENVAHIITYGEVKAKTAIRDAFRVMGIDLGITNRIAKLADAPLDIILNYDEQQLKEKIHKRNELENVLKFKKIVSENPHLIDPLKKAATIEGAIRNRGLHACGFIIAPQSLNKFIPVTQAKDTDLLVTQFDSKVVEDAGLLKMDFLGIKTLSIINDTLKMIKERHGVEADIDHLDFDDDKTYQLFREGRTVGVFQFESDGMRKYLKDLKPTEFEDLIAMVALYRPGPMDKIPSYIARKHGLEKVTYDLDVMEEILKPTYGITVYQEQVMLLSQKIAGFTGGQADSLRKAMGKKIAKELEKLRPAFMEGGMKNGHPKEILEKIWQDWESFAHYAFNRSHAVSYAVVAYQTAWLKANYTAEFLAASLSHHISSRDKVTKFIEDAKAHGIDVLPPDVNESGINFNVNAQGNIRFGLAAIKGVGESAAEEIIRERKNGEYLSLYDFIRRVNLSVVNARVLEGLAKAGAFDGFGFERNDFICNDAKFIKDLLYYGQKYRKEKQQTGMSLFEGMKEMELPEPKPSACDTPLPPSEVLDIEKDLLGFYVSGHPLDMFCYQIDFYKKYDLKYLQAVSEAISNQKDVVLSNGVSESTDEFEYDADTGEIIQAEEILSEETVGLQEAKMLLGKKLQVTGFITEVKRITTKRGKSMAFFKLEDYTGELEFGIFGETYLKKEHLLKEDRKVGIRAVLEENYNRPGTYSFRVLDIFPLENTFDLYSRGLTVLLNEVNVNQELVNKLIDITSRHKGKKTLDVLLYSLTDHFQVKLTSRKQKVSINPDLLEELEKEGFEFKIH